MTAGNGTPIFSSIGRIIGSTVLTTAAADYTGQGANNIVLVKAAPTYGSFIQRLRFKALGTNVATVARVYINEGSQPWISLLAAPAGTPTGTPSGSGGTLPTVALFAKIYAVDQYGTVSPASTESASVSVTGPTGSVAWAWTAVVGAVSYIIAVGGATGKQTVAFSSTTNSYTQTAPYTGAGVIGVGPTIEADTLSPNGNYFYGEVSLPATTASATTATVDIDYSMNIALEYNTTLASPHSVVIGLGTTVAAGWVAVAIGGDYTP